MVPLKIVSNVLRFKPALNLNRVLADFGGFKPRLKFFKFHLGLTLRQLEQVVQYAFSKDFMTSKRDSTLNETSPSDVSNRQFRAKNFKMVVIEINA